MQIKLRPYFLELHYLVFVRSNGRMLQTRRLGVIEAGAHYFRYVGTACVGGFPRSWAEAVHMFCRRMEELRFRSLGVIERVA